MKNLTISLFAVATLFGTTAFADCNVNFIHSNQTIENYREYAAQNRQEFQAYLSTLKKHGLNAVSANEVKMYKIFLLSGIKDPKMITTFIKISDEAGNIIHQQEEITDIGRFNFFIENFKHKKINKAILDETLTKLNLCP